MLPLGPPPSWREPLTARGYPDNPHPPTADQNYNPYTRDTVTHKYNHINGPIVTLVLCRCMSLLYSKICDRDLGRLSFTNSYTKCCIYISVYVSTAFGGIRLNLAHSGIDYILCYFSRGFWILVRCPLRDVSRRKSDVVSIVLLS